MRDINPESPENVKASRENDAYVKSLQFLAANPHNCTQCGYPISYVGRCAACVEDDSIFCAIEKLK